MVHPNIKDRNEIIDWARELFQNPDNYVILDTETTGLGETDVVIQIGIIDLQGNVLLDTLVRPTKRKRISKEATAIHGITMKMLQDAPTLYDICDQLDVIFLQKTIIIYNARYDTKMLQQTWNQDKIGGEMTIHAKCAMDGYSKFIGEWSDFHNEYKYQKLPCAGHSAIEDCKATLKVLHEMADAEIITSPKKWYELWK